MTSDYPGAATLWYYREVMHHTFNLALLACLTNGCGDGTGLYRYAALNPTVSDTLVSPGDTISLNVSATGSSGLDLPKPDITLGSSDPQLISILSDGMIVINATRLGTVWITVDGGGLRDSILVRVAVPFVQIAPGGGHTCGLTADGQAFCWGVNINGRLGDNSDINSSWPVPVSGGHVFTQIATGGSHSCAIAAQATWCWGNGQEGQRGDGTVASAFVPVQVAGSDPFDSIASTESLTCGWYLNSLGSCWGNGAIGSGSFLTSQVQLPQVIDSVTIWHSIVTGTSHACGLSGTTAYCWGSHTRGQVGRGEQYLNTRPPSLLGSIAPLAIADSIEFTALATGTMHSCGIAVGGSVWCWGEAEYGKLGAPPPNTCDNVPCAWSPLAVPGIILASIDAGRSHTCGLTPAGQAFCWGRNQEGQLGTASAEACFGQAACSQAPLPTAGALRFSSLVVGHHHACGIALGGGAYCWGANNGGQLGDGTTTNRPTPVLMLGSR